jgi:gliding motility-associated-like protein
VWEETLILIGPTEARFALPDTACSLTVSLDNQSINAIDYRWDLGDGTQSTQANPTHTYAQGGNYTVTLITDPSGTCPDTLSRLLYIPTLVQAALDTSRERCALTIDFDASLSSAGASQFTWDFGDGSAPRTTAGPTTQHTYRRRGTYAVTLTVNADSTCPSVFTIPAVAAGSDVFADFTSPNVLCDSMFAPANTTTGPATDYLWDMGDGTTSTLPNPTHRYAQPGTYTIRLIAEPGTLCADTAVRTVRVSETPRADFEILQEACGGLLTLTDRSSGPVATRRWLLPEGQRPTDAVVTTTFGFSQVARLSLVVTDSLGCADTATVDYRYDPTGLSYLHIPNVFTPNGDGVNDRFEIKGLSNQCLTECVIYDRWGAVSYRTTDPGLNWDGTVGGVPAAEGVYVYVLLIDGKAHRVGTVTLLR